MSAPARTEAGSIEGPVVTMARTGTGGDRVDASLEQVGLALLAGAEADQDQRHGPVPDLDVVDVTDQRRCVEHRPDAHHVGGVRRVGLELLRHRDDRARAGVVDVAEPLDRREPERARCAFAIDSPGANISTSSPPRKIVYGVWNSVAVGTPRASATSMAVNSMQSTSTASAGSRSSSRARSPAMAALKHRSSMRSFISASKSSGSSMSSQPSPWLRATKRAPVSAHRSAIVP